MKIGRHVRRVYINKLRVGGRAPTRVPGAINWDLVRSVHFSAVIHLDEGSVSVTQIVVVSERYGGQGNDLSPGIHATVGDVSIRQTMKQIVGCAVFLKNNYHMLNFLRHE